MMFRDPKSQTGLNMRSLIVIGLLIVLVALISYMGFDSDTQRVVEKRAEEICGEGNVKSIEGATIECGAPEEDSE